MSMQPQAAQRTLRSEINVTPLVDVCLVLLIIFMVVMPILHAGVEVDLPKTSKVPAMPGDSQPLTVSIQADGSVWVRGTRVAETALRETLEAIHLAEPDREVIVRGDRRLGYERVCTVLALLSEVGFKQVGLVTEKEPG